MSKKSRNREITGRSNSSVCMKMPTCTCSWKAGSKCSKNRCKYYKDPRDPKNCKKK